MAQLCKHQSGSPLREGGCRHACHGDACRDSRPHALPGWPCLGGQAERTSCASLAPAPSCTSTEQSQPALRMDTRGRELCTLTMEEGREQTREGQTSASVRSHPLRLSLRFSGSLLRLSFCLGAASSKPAREEASLPAGTILLSAHLQDQAPSTLAHS